MNLKGKVALVTGGTHGLGRAIVERYIKEGAQVAFCSRNKAEIKKLEAFITEQGGQALGIEADVQYKDQVDCMVDTVLKKWGHIDVLVSNAGICPSAPFLEITESDWDLVMNVNLKGQFLVSQKVAQAMVKEGKGGSIILMSSVNGLAAEAEIAHYNVTKGGINLLTMSEALELAQHNIRVNAILPGFIDTRLNRDDIDNEAWLKEYLKTIPAGRVGTTADIAGAAFYLASDDSTYVTGHLMIVDGGQMAKLS